MITPTQAKWASQHDWFESYDEEAGTVQAIDSYTKNGQAHFEHVTFSNLDDLMTWANY